jgi:hypothetical protein
MMRCTDQTSGQNCRNASPMFLNPFTKGTSTGQPHRNGPTDKNKAIHNARRIATNEPAKQ